MALTLCLKLSFLYINCW